MDVEIKKTRRKVPGRFKPELAHTDHTSELPRLRRVRGQLEGVEKMILEKRYCIEILQQTRAAQSALRAFESAILQAHLKGCVRSVFDGRSGVDVEKKLEEIVQLFAR